MRPVLFSFLPLLGLLVGCKPSEEAFVQDFVEADCAYLIECTSEPILNFQGWQTEADCQADRGPEVATQAANCIYDKRVANACLDAVEDQICAAEGEDREYPPICADVFTECTNVDPGEDPDTESDSEADTL